MTARDGGPAYPQSAPFQDGNGNWHYNDPGMSLRDWFAGQALAGICSNPNHQLGEVTYNTVGADAYLFADAMIAAREAKP